MSLFFVSLNLLACRFFDESIELQTTVPIVQATAIWSRGPMIQISSEGIFSEDALIVPIKNWDISEQYLTGFTITPLLDHLEVDYNRNELGNEIERLLIAADPNTPYQLISNILYTSGQAGIGKFGFIVESTDVPIPPRVKYRPVFIAENNSKPLLEGAQISPADVRVGDEISCRPTKAIDKDEDRLSFSAEWTVNGESTEKSLMMKAENIGDQIQCALVATDGMSFSEIKKSEVVEVLDQDGKGINYIGNTGYLSGVAYPNCIEMIQLTIDRNGTVDLSESKKELIVRGLKDEQRFKEWSELYHSRSIAGHNGLMLNQRIDTDLNTTLTYASTWMKNEGSQITLLLPEQSPKLNGIFKLSSASSSDQTFQPNISKSQPSILKSTSQIPVIEIELPSIVGETYPVAAPTCVGKDGKRYPNSGKRACHILDNETLRCEVSMSIEEKGSIPAAF